MSLQPPGAGININLLLSNKAYLAAFPLHDYDSLKVVVVVDDDDVVVVVFLLFVPKR